MTSDEVGQGEGDDWLLQGSTDTSDIAEYYDRWAGSYDDDLDAWSYEAPGMVAARVVEHQPGAASVLDAGCGTGLVGQALRDAGFTGTLHGVDLSDDSLRIAAGRGVYASLHQANLQEPLDVADDSFDAVVCVGVMTYVPDVEEAWREFARVVRPGGLVVVTQREDLWEPRDCQGVIDRLEADGTWTAVDVTGPESYLPGNEDGMAEIGVHYVTARVR